MDQLDHLIDTWRSLKTDFESQLAESERRLAALERTDHQGARAVAVNRVLLLCDDSLVAAGFFGLERFRDGLAERHERHRLRGQPDDDALVEDLVRECSDRCTKALDLQQRLPSTGSPLSAMREDVLADLQGLCRTLDDEVRLRLRERTTLRAGITQRQGIGEPRDQNLNRILDELSAKLLDQLTEFSTSHFARIARRYQGYQALIDSIPPLLTVATLAAGGTHIPRPLSSLVSWLSTLTVVKPITRRLELRRAKQRAVALWVASRVIPFTLMPSCAALACSTQLDVVDARARLALVAAAP